MSNGFKYELGSTLKDKITGYTGVVRVRSQYLTGCNCYGLQSRELKDGKPVDWVYSDEDLLIEVASSEDLDIDKSARETGGPLDSSQNPPSQRG